MHTLRIEHRVHDYDRWKQVFDGDPADVALTGHPLDGGDPTAARARAA
jgi:hypothetical protein